MLEIRAATGNDGNPVTANQTLGQNGPFTPLMRLWLDRAFVRATPTEWLTAYAGRMSNPFWTTDLIYYDDLGFDGFAASVTPRFNKSWSAFLTAGAFPVFNTAFNFGSTSEDSSFSSRNAWLFAVQGGAQWEATKDISTKLAAGYFDYSNISGKISSPCTITFSSDTCNTDDSRALFPENGNTMMPLRSLVLASPTSPQPQFFGLATPFHISTSTASSIWTCSGRSESPSTPNSRSILVSTATGCLRWASTTSMPTRTFRTQATRPG